MLKKCAPLLIHVFTFTIWFRWDLKDEHSSRCSVATAAAASAATAASFDEDDDGNDVEKVRRTTAAPTKMLKFSPRSFKMYI